MNKHHRDHNCNKKNLNNLANGCDEVSKCVCAFTKFAQTISLETVFWTIIKLVNSISWNSTFFCVSSPEKRFDDDLFHRDRFLSENYFGTKNRWRESGEYGQSS